MAYRAESSICSSSNCYSAYLAGRLYGMFDRVAKVITELVHPCDQRIIKREIQKVFSRLL